MITLFLFTGLLIAGLTFTILMLLIDGWRTRKPGHELPKQTQDR